MDRRYLWLSSMLLVMGISLAGGWSARGQAARDDPGHEGQTAPRRRRFSRTRNHSGRAASGRGSHPQRAGASLLSQRDVALGLRRVLGADRARRDRLHRVLRSPPQPGPQVGPLVVSHGRAVRGALPGDRLPDQFSAGLLRGFCSPARLRPVEPEPGQVADRFPAERRHRDDRRLRLRLGSLPAAGAGRAGGGCTRLCFPCPSCSRLCWSSRSGSIPCSTISGP